LGVISSEELVDVLVEEATEDVSRMASLPPMKYPYFEIPFWRLLYLRGYVLVAFMIAESFSGTLLRSYGDVMKVGIFYPQNEMHRNTLKSFSEGVKNSGETVEINDDDRYVDCDVAVIFGTWKKKVPASYGRGRIFAEQKRRGKSTIVIDSGYIKRDRYYMVGIDGLNGRANFNNANVPSDRWNALGVDLLPWRLDGGPIIICGQIPWDAACQHADNVIWCQSAIKRIEEITARPVIFRPHPLVIDIVDYETNGIVISTQPLEEDLKDAWALVTFNSNSGVEAVIAGVPVFVGDAGSMVLSVANVDLSLIEKPMFHDRSAWAKGIAYAQWTLEEMASGKPWNHLKDACVV